VWDLSDAREPLGAKSGDGPVLVFDLALTELMRFAIQQSQLVVPQDVDEAFILQNDIGNSIGMGTDLHEIADIKYAVFIHVRYVI
jgi:hypothetical protein